MIADVVIFSDGNNGFVIHTQIVLRCNFVEASCIVVVSIDLDYTMS